MHHEEDEEHDIAQLSRGRTRSPPSPHSPPAAKRSRTHSQRSDTPLGGDYMRERAPRHGHTFASREQSLFGLSSRPTSPTISRHISPMPAPANVPRPRPSSFFARSPSASVAPSSRAPSPSASRRVRSGSLFHNTASHASSASIVPSRSASLAPVSPRTSSFAQNHLRRPSPTPSASGAPSAKQRSSKSSIPVLKKQKKAHIPTEVRDSDPSNSRPFHNEQFRDEWRDNQEVVQGLVHDGIDHSRNFVDVFQRLSIVEGTASENSNRLDVVEQTQENCGDQQEVILRDLSIIQGENTHFRAEDEEFQARVKLEFPNVWAEVLDLRDTVQGLVKAAEPAGYAADDEDPEGGPSAPSPQRKKRKKRRSKGDDILPNTDISRTEFTELVRKTTYGLMGVSHTTGKLPKPLRNGKFWTKRQGLGGSSKLRMAFGESTWTDNATGWLDTARDFIFTNGHLHTQLTFDQIACIPPFLIDEQLQQFWRGLKTRWEMQVTSAANQSEKSRRGRRNTRKHKKLKDRLDTVDHLPELLAAHPWIRKWLLDHGIRYTSSDSSAYEDASDNALEEEAGSDVDAPASPVASQPSTSSSSSKASSDESSSEDDGRSASSMAKRKGKGRGKGKGKGKEVPCRPKAVKPRQGGLKFWTRRPPAYRSKEFQDIIIELDAAVLQRRAAKPNVGPPHTKVVHGPPAERKLPALMEPDRMIPRHFVDPLWLEANPDQELRTTNVPVEHFPEKLRSCTTQRPDTDIVPQNNAHEARSGPSYEGPSNDPFQTRVDSRSPLSDRGSVHGIPTVWDMQASDLDGPSTSTLPAVFSAEHGA